MRDSRAFSTLLTTTLLLASFLALASAGCGSSSSDTNGAGGAGTSGTAGRGGSAGNTAGSTSGGSGGSAGSASGGSDENGSGGEVATAGAPSGGEGGADTSGTPVDVAGEYTVSLTNTSNDCMMPWKDGATTNGVLFTIRQTGTQLKAEADGDAALSLVLLTGTNLFDGDVHGNGFTLLAQGPTVFSAGNCMYTVNATVEGTIEGNTIHGTLTYAPVVSSDPECAQYACAAVEDFTGARPSGS